MTQAINALVPWFGGKRTLAPEIVAELGDHACYFEPFCGSMAVLLAKPPCRSETVNDLHADLTNLARVIQHPLEGPRFYRRLRRTLVSEGIFRDAIEKFSEPFGGELDGDRAYHYFVVSWLGRNGIAGTTVGQRRGAGHSFCVRYTSNGGTPSRRWASAAESVMSWRERIRAVTILRRDALEVIGKIEDKAGTVVYVDSPYLPSTRSGWDGSGGTARYLHDFTLEDHSRLAAALGRFRQTRVVVSYYDSPELATLYPGWRVRRLEASKGIANASKRGGGGATEALEVLLVNDMAESGASLFDLFD